MVQAADPLATERNLLRLAQQGDPQAIANLLNRALNPRGISVQTRLDQDCLQVLLEGFQVPARDVWVPYLQQGMTNLGSPVVRRLQVYGRQRGQSGAVWQEAVVLSTPVVPFNPAALGPVNLAAHISGNLTGQQIAIGSKILQLTNYGGVVNLTPPQAVSPRPRQTPTAELYCRPFPSLIDRRGELDTALGALKMGQPVEIHAPAGMGKTALLRTIAHSPDTNYTFRDGVVYRVVRQQPLDDLMQSFFDDFYEYGDGIPRKPTETELLLALRGKRSLLILDDVELPSESVHQLITTLSSFSVLLATPDQRFWGEGQAFRLAGLPLEDALVLLERALGGALLESDRPAATILCNQLQGHPLRIVQAAALVRDRNLPLATIAQQVGSLPSPESLTLRGAAALPEPERRVLAALGVLGGTPVRAHHLAALTAVPNLQPVLETLIRQGLVVSDGMQFALAGNLVEPLHQFWNLTPWVQPTVQHFLRWASQHSDITGALAQEADVLLRVTELAAHHHHWAEVLQLVQHLDSGFTLSGYWGSWEQLWQWGLQAGQNLGNQSAIALALHQLGTRACCLDDPFTAHSYLMQAWTLRESLGDIPAAAITRHNLDLLLNPVLPEPPRPQPPPIAPSPQTMVEPLAPPRRDRSGLASAIPFVIIGTLVAGLGGFLVYQLMRSRPNFTLSTNQVVFPAQELNTTSDARTVTLTNQGDQPLQLGRIAPTGDHATDFQVTDTCTRAPLPPQQNCQIQITFTPQAEGTRTAELEISDRRGTIHQTIDLEGTGKAPTNTTAILNFDPGTLDFGDQRLNQQSAPRRITVTNGGTTPLTIRSINTSGQAQTEFKGNENCTRAPLAPNSTCQLDLTFQPTTIGARTANLTIVDSNNNRWNVPLRGNGVAASNPTPTLSLSPGNLDFGNQAVGTFSREDTITVSNFGSEPLQVNQVRLEGETLLDFQITRDTCTNNTVNPNRSCQISVRFGPRTPGYRSARVEITSNDPRGTARVFLSGVGTQPTQAGIRVNPTRLNFGRVNLETASPARTVVIQNTGNAPLQIGDIQRNGNPDFVSDRSSELGAECQNITLAPGASCGFGVVFLPQVAGDRMARLVIPNNVQANLAILLEGTGVGQVQAPDIAISPNSLAFGGVEVGQVSEPRSVTIRNPGNAPLQIGQMGVRGSHPNDFYPNDASFGGCSNRTLPAQGSCSFQMFFGPTAAGDRTAQLTIPNNSPQGNVSIPLGGRGNPQSLPGISANPAALDMGAVTLGESRTQSVVLSNTGNAPLRINNIGLVTGGIGYQLDLSSAGVGSCLANALSPGETCGFGVIFTPQQVGQQNNEILVTSNAPGSPLRIEVFGIGQPAQVIPLPDLQQPSTRPTQPMPFNVQPR